MNNLYIEALRYGRINMADGISFHQLMKHLDSLGYKFSATYLHYLQFWFYKNFYQPEITINLILSNHGTGAALSNMSRHNKELCILTGEGLDLLIEYEQVEEARKSANQAKKISIIAIWISGGLAAVSIVLQIWLSRTN